MQTPVHSGLRPAVLAACLLAGAPWAAHAQSPAPATVPAAARTYDIPPQALGATLTRIAQESGARFSIDSALVHGHSSPAIHGHYTAEQAAQKALAHSGLQLARTGNGTLTVMPLQGAEAAVPGEGGHGTAGTALPEVTVSGKAPGSTTEGTGAYTTSSTSSSTRLNLTPQETPQAISVLTRQRLYDQHLATVADALEAAPGIVLQHTTFGQDGPAVYARGSYLQNYQIDGVPTSSTMSPFLDNTTSYDRIELVRGATGIMNGLGTPAATVNLIRKRPTVAPQRAVTAELGRWDRAGAGADISGPLNESASARARLVADTSRRHAWVDRFKQTNQSLYGIVELDVGDKTLVTAGFSHLASDTRSPIMGRPLFFGNGQRIPLGLADNGTPGWNYYDHASTGVFSSVEHYFDSGWVGKVELGHSRYRYDGVVNSILGSIDAATGDGAEISPARWESRPTQNTLDAYVSGQYAAFGRRHELIAGISLMQLRSQSPDYWSNDDFVSAANIYDWTTGTAAPTFTDEGRSTAKERLQSVYASTRLRLGDATSLLLGTRLTHWTADRSNAAQRSEQVFVPYLGVVHALNGTWSLYGSYTKIFQPQTARTIRYSGLAAVDPEEGMGYEIGAKASFLDGRFHASANAYQSNVDNLAIWNPEIYRYEILGKTRTRGIEIELNGALTRNWQVSASYATARVVDQNGQRTLGHLPQQTVKLFTTKRFAGPWNPLTVGGGVSWQSAISGGGLFNYTQGSMALVNLMARYEVDKHLAVSLHLTNALDKRYYSSVMSNYGTYGAPRNLVLSAKYSF